MATDVLVEQILEKASRIKTREELGQYLEKAAAKLKPKPRYETRDETLYGAMQSYFAESAPTFSLAFNRAPLNRLSSFFYLTCGLHVIGGPSGHGKTLWAMEWAFEAAQLGKQVLVVSLEMSAKELALRKLSQLTGKNLYRLTRRDLPERTLQVCQELASEQSDLQNIHVLALGDYDWSRIKAQMMGLMLKRKPELVIVDYAQMMHDSSAKDERQSKMLAEIARELKLFADQHQTAAMLLSQFNRESVKNATSKKWDQYVPLFGDAIKESGGLVEAADSVQTVCIPERFDGCPFEFRGKFQVLVDKSRHLGQLGHCLFDFNTELMTFEGAAHDRVHDISR